MPCTLGIEKRPKLNIISFYRQRLFPFSELPYGIRYIFNCDVMATYPSEQNEIVKIIKSLKPEEKLKIVRYLGCQYYLGNKPLFSQETSKKILIGDSIQYLETISDKPAWPPVVYDILQAETEQKRPDIFINPEFDLQKTVIIGKGIRLSETIAKKINGRQDKDYFLDILEEKAGPCRYKINLT